MRIARIAAVVGSLSVMLGACDGILDLKDLEAVSEADVWNDPDLAEAIILAEDLSRRPDAAG